MKKALFFIFISILANYHISTLSAQVPTAPGNYQWVKGFGSAFSPSTNFGNEAIVCTKLDYEGNILVSGIVSGYPHVQGLGGKKDSIISNHWQASAKASSFLSKYDCNGNLLWFKMLNDSLNSTGIGDFVIDSANNIYIPLYCNYGTTNIYWNDSLFAPFSWTPTIVSSFILAKIDKNGSINWIWGEPYHVSGFSLGFGDITSGSSGSPRSNSMVMHHDTISFFTYFGNTYGISLNSKLAHRGMNILDFSKQTGALLNHTNITDTSGFSTAGIGIDKNGDFTAVVNFEFPVNKFLDSTFSRTTSSSFNPLSTVIKFNRSHVIRHIEFGDSTGATGIELNTLGNRFDINTFSHNGHAVYGTFAPAVKSIFGKYYISNSVLHFENLNSFKWGACPDTSYSSRGFSSVSSDINGDVYSRSPFNEYFKYNNLIATTPHNYFDDFIVRFSNLNGAPLFRYPSLSLQTSNNQSNRVTFQNILNDETGNLFLTGNLNSNSIFAGMDTANYYGGQNDMFIIKYGNPCSNTAPLITAAAPIDVLAQCNSNNIKITWKDISTTEDKYYIYRSLSAASGYTKIDSVAANTTQYTDNLVQANTSYWYALSAHNAMGEGYMSVIDSSMLCNVGINSISINNKQLIIYPNPASQSIVISHQSLVNTVEVSNVLGQVCIIPPYQGGKGDVFINIAALPSGIYFIKATDTNGNVMNGKFVKE